MHPFQTSFFTRPSVLFLQAIYFFISLAFLYYLDQETPYLAAADAASWVNPARAFLALKASLFSDSQVFFDSYRTPLVPIFNAPFLWLGKELGFKLIVLAQILILAVTAVLIGKTAEKIHSGIGHFAMALLLFNPNTWSSAFLIQSETLFSFLVASSFCCLMRYIHVQSWASIMSAGILLALATLARPTTQYLIILFPILIPILLQFKETRKESFKIRIGQCLLSGVVAMLVLVPWASKVAKVEGELTLTTSEIRSIYVRDQVLTLRSFTSGDSIEQSILWEASSANGKKRRICIQLPKGSPERVNCFKAILKNNWKDLLAQPTASYIGPLVRSAAGFFLSGASGNWHNLFGSQEEENTTVVWSKASQKEAFAAVVAIFSSLEFSSALVTVICISFSVSMKFLALAGAYELYKRKEYVTLAILIGLILYFFFTTLFLGQSRYRVPAEPYIMVLAAIGITFITKLFVSKSAATHSVK